MSNDRIELPRTNHRALRFTGEHIASASTSGDSGFADFSGVSGRWETAAVYRTARGRYVVAWANRTQWHGERSTYHAEVCDTLDAVATVIEADVPTCLSAELLEELGVAEDLDQDAETT